MTCPTKQKKYIYVSCASEFTFSQMVATTIKKHQRPAALKKRIERMKIQLQQLEDTYATATAGDAASSTALPQPPLPPVEEDQAQEDEQ